MSRIFSLQRYFPRENQLHLWGLSTVIDRAGNGFLLTIEIIYLTKFLHFSAVTVGLAFSIATIIGLPSTFIAGHRSQRGNNKQRYIFLIVLLGISFVLYAFITALWQFFILTIISSFLSNASGTFRGVLMNANFDNNQERVNFRSYIRGYTNFGIGMGSAFASLALIFENAWILRGLIVLDALSFFINAFIFNKVEIKHQDRVSENENKNNRWVALKDPHYVAATLLGSVFMTHFTFQAIGIPLWIVYYTHAPHWSIALILVFNTTACVLFARTFSKKGEEIERAAKLYARASLLVLVAMVTYGLAHKAPAHLAVGILLVGMLFHVIAELAGVSAGWTLSLSMMQEKFMGQYQALWQMSFNFAGIIGPTLITFLIVHYQVWGLVMYGGFVAAAGLLFLPLTQSYLNKVK